MSRRLAGATLLALTMTVTACGGDRLGAGSTDPTVEVSEVADVTPVDDSTVTSERANESTVPSTGIEAGGSTTTSVEVTPTTASPTTVAQSSTETTAVVQVMNDAEIAALEAELDAIDALLGEVDASFAED